MKPFWIGLLILNAAFVVGLIWLMIRTRRAKKYLAGQCETVLRATEMLKTTTEEAERLTSQALKEIRRALGNDPTQTVGKA